MDSLNAPQPSRAHSPKQKSAVSTAWPARRIQSNNTPDRMANSILVGQSSRSKPITVRLSAAEKMGTDNLHLVAIKNSASAASAIRSRRRNPFQFPSTHSARSQRQRNLSELSPAAQLQWERSKLTTMLRQ